MAYGKLKDFIIKFVRSSNAVPCPSPEPIKKGTVVLSSDLSFISVCSTEGCLAGDNFYTQFTAGSNIVVLPINNLQWTGLKLYSPQFPNGVSITAKGAGYNEYVIATPATTTRKEYSNFCVLKSVALKPFLGK